MRYSGHYGCDHGCHRRTHPSGGVGSIVFVAPAGASKAILAWKADLVDYAYGFPNLPVTWGYQTHKDEIDQAAERFIGA